MQEAVHPQYDSIHTVLAQTYLPDASPRTYAEALVEIGFKKQITQLVFDFGYPANDLAECIKAELQSILAGLSLRLDITLAWHPVGPKAGNNENAVKGVKHIVAISSGKGGVGKSTTTANVAMALASQGARVGVLDADIYGPSQAQMLGVADQRPEILAPNLMAPIEAVGGIHMISMANLVTEKTPMVWRGPMVSGALQQLLRQTHWPDIDYLLIDMPPGTGDIQLTLSQTVPVSGAVVVTTPQDIALLDAQKGIEMFRKVNIPVLGVIENMSTHTCRQCGHNEAIFGEHGGDRLSKEYDVALLGRLPLALAIRQQTDAGTPLILNEPDAQWSQQYCRIARRIGAELWSQSLSGPKAPVIKFVDD